MTEDPTRISCLLIEDNALSIEMMVGYIEKRPDLKLIGAALELAEVRDMLNEHDPDLIFLDLIIPPGVSKGFHFGKLPLSASIISISAIPLDHYKGIKPRGEVYELPKPFSFESFDRCINQVLAHRKKVIHVIAD